MTSRPARVRLSILIDATDERLCADDCPRGDADGCFLRIETTRPFVTPEKRRTHEPPDFTRSPRWDRTEFCLSATKAVELDEAIVAAAEAVRDDDADLLPGCSALRLGRSYAHARHKELVRAVDAKRAAEKI